MDVLNHEAVAAIEKMLKGDNTFTSESPREKAEDILNQFTYSKQVDFSPNRYGILRQEEGKKVISVIQKGHNFYVDKVIGEIEIQ